MATVRGPVGRDASPVTRLMDRAREGERQCPLCSSFDLVDAFRVKRGPFVRCRTCGLIFLQGINPDHERALYATDVAETGRERVELRRAVFESSLCEIERIKRPGRILDVGCGEGHFLDLARRRGWETYGVDLSPRACAHARDVLGLHVRCGDLAEATFADSFFDVVTLYDVLCQLPSPLAQLVEIRRILRVGGLLVIRVRNATFHRLIRVSRRLELHLVCHLFCFTPKTLRRLLEQAGYSQVSVRNSVLTSSDPYSVSPLLGDWGMQAIKRGVYLVAELVSHVSAHSVILGPSLKAHATKGSIARADGPGV